MEASSLNIIPDTFPASEIKCENNRSIEDNAKQQNSTDTEESESKLHVEEEFVFPKNPELKKAKKEKIVALKSEKLKLPIVVNEANVTENIKPNIASHYQEPEWSGLADAKYSFDVLKNGSIIDTVSLNTKAFYIFGRLPSCDISLEHPSLSRFHAVVQYAAKPNAVYEKGWYIYDLDSTHGTWINKNKISPNVYHRLKVGYIVKFGGSSRLYILQGPVEDEDEESEMTVTELKAQKDKLQKQADLLRQIEVQEEMKRIEEEQQILEDRGCSWGMDDEPETTGEVENNFVSLIAENESLYIDDPKKALKGFYEREGCDLPDYQFTEIAAGKHKCRLELPVDGPNGEELIAEAVVSGKRKDAVVACALEACRILDRLGLLRSSTHESRKRKQKKWEDDDYYDSDEDTFLDRTGTIEKKRVMRMKKAGKDEAETYESLLKKYNTVTAQIKGIESQLQKAKAEAEVLATDGMDELDAYMVSIKSGGMNTKTRIQLKGDLLKLKGEEQKLRRLINIVKPPALPPLKPFSTPIVQSSETDVTSKKSYTQQKHIKKSPNVRMPQNTELKPDDYEEQDEDDDKIEEVKNSTEEIDNAITQPAIQCHSSLKDSSSQPNHPKTSVPVAASTDTRVRTNVKSTSFQSTMSALESLKKGKNKTKTEGSYDEDDPKYAMWIPPSEQAGDGRTSLNEKLGY